MFSERLIKAGEETRMNLEKQNSKNSEFKRGKQSNQPKQNKNKESATNTGSSIDLSLIETQRSFISNQISSNIGAGIGLQLGEPPMVTTPSITVHQNKSLPTKNLKSSGKHTEKHHKIPKHVKNKNKFTKEVNDADIQNDQIPDESSNHSQQKIQNEPEQRPQQPFVDSETVKLYNRQESSQASVTSEPNQQTRNRLSNVQSNNSWVDNEEAEESFHPKSDYTDDQYENSENKNVDNGSEDHSRNSQSAEDSNKSDHNTNEAPKNEHDSATNPNK